MIRSFRRVTLALGLMLLSAPLTTLIPPLEQEARAEDAKRRVLRARDVEGEDVS
ncbi:MAG: hypothetical protein HN348_13530, partial [Proteobacteria bacterium]|nr:hypothetical protein [Pseudomonadota bacterium]